MDGGHVNGGRVTNAQLAQTLALLRDALRAEAETIRVEIAGRLDGIETHLGGLDTRLRRIEEHPARQWIAGRATAIFDRLLPLAAVAAFTYLIAHMTT